jgi:hypothetical protein
MARLIADKYRQWQAQCDERFNRLKSNEEELNRIFIELYGLQDELTPEVKDQDVTVRRAELQREIKSLISYAVGCIFGRYSPDTEGLCYAGGEWDPTVYNTVLPVADNIALLCEQNHDGDLTDRLVDFVESVYGQETLEENLRFIADALGGKGSARQVIRHYLLSGFYADHVKIYRKRPIYWQFSSGKQNGFKALIYMHRYEPSLLQRMAAHYVPEQHCHHRSRLSELEAATGDRALLKKQIAKVKEQLRETEEFEEKLRLLAQRRLCLDPDDGVKANYAMLQDVLEPIR